MKLHDLIAPFRGGKLLLIHPPTFNFESFDREVLLNRGYYCYPPRSLQCLQTAVSDLVESKILDLNGRIKETKENCGWNLKVLSAVEDIPWPAVNELAILRALDPKGYCIGF